MGILMLISMLLGFLAILYYLKQIANSNNKILVILQDLQDVTNLDIPKETSANLTDIGKQIKLEDGAIENITRTNSLWEEDGLDGEEIEDVYAR
jgi:hypothetical protein